LVSGLINIETTVKVDRFPVNYTAVREQLAADHIPGNLVAGELDATPQSVILYDPSGQRMINVDLKNIQDTPYPLFAPVPGRDAAARRANRHRCARHQRPGRRL
jgi:hypothetical protein